MRQFQVQGIELATGKSVEYKLRAVDATAVRVQAKIDGISVVQVKEVPPVKQGRSLPKDWLGTGCLISLVGFLVSVLVFGCYVVITDQITAHRHRRWEEEYRATQYGPHWREAVEYAGTAINDGNVRSSMRSGALWYVNEDSTPDYNQTTGEYSVSVYTYGAGRNPLNGTDRQYGRVVVKGAPGSWSFVRWQ